MQDYPGAVAELRQQVQHRLQEMEQLSARWQQAIDARLSDLAGRLPELDRGRDDAVPVDAPAQFREVSEKFESGQLDWLTVWRGDTEHDAVGLPRFDGHPRSGTWGLREDVEHYGERG